MMLFKVAEGKNHPAMFHTFTESDENILREYRREAANSTQEWSKLRKEIRDREWQLYIKEQLRASQRMEKACTIWLSYFLDIGYRTTSHFPIELEYELDILFGAIYCNEKP